MDIAITTKSLHQFFVSKLGVYFVMLMDHIVRDRLGYF